MKTTINEKTLELNICEEYLQVIRKDHPKAYWFGPTTQEERELGYDAAIEGAEGYALYLQFKRPLRYKGATPKEYPYTFHVETHQHETLKKLASEYPGSVEYAFPLIGDKTELSEGIPNLRAETYFCPLDKAPELDSSQQSHRVEVYPDRAEFFSVRIIAYGYRGRWIRSRFLGKRLRRVSHRDFVAIYDALIGAFAHQILPGLKIGEHVPRAMFIPLR